MSFRVSPSEPIAGDKDEAISPIFAPCKKNQTECGDAEVIGRMDKP
jgi:hypothetical protein